MIIALFEEYGIPLQPIDFMYSPLRSTQEWFESKELQCILMRMAISGGVDITQPGKTQPLWQAFTRPYMCFNRGGTHQVAHACHKILIAEGAKIWTHSEVEKVTIENGTATGIWPWPKLPVSQQPLPTRTSTGLLSISWGVKLRRS